MYLSELLADIFKTDVINWQNTLIEFKDPKTGKKLSKSFLKTIHNQLSAILNFAVRNYDLKVNVAAQVGNMGSEDEIKIDFWTKEEYMKVSEELMIYPLITNNTICGSNHTLNVEWE